MAVKRADRAGDSGAEERFAQLFCEAFGEEKGQSYQEHLPHRNNALYRL